MAGERARGQDSAPTQPLSFPDVQLHICGCASWRSPESILPVVVLDSGLARFTRALSDKRDALAREMTAKSHPN